MRWASWSLLIAGLTLGSFTDRTAARPPLQANGRYVLAADFHVHAFPGDGMLPAWELRKEAARRGIDVIAITNHNQSIAAKFPPGGELPLVIPGQEVTTPKFHLAAIGVRRVVDWRLPLRQIVDDVHSQGGAAIAAHPLRDSWRLTDNDALGGLDGAESVTRGRDAARRLVELEAFYRTGRQHNPLLAAIGSSDFHSIAPLARCLTYVAVDEISERGVLDAIRAGRTVASDGEDLFFGDPSIAAVVRTAGRPRPPLVDSSPWRPIAVGMVLVALVALICVR